MSIESTKDDLVDIVQSNTRSRLHEITPLSKYFAMVLFILMPFIGGWIGYTNAPEKVIEVERVILKEVPIYQKNQISKSVLDSTPTSSTWKTYRNDTVGIEFLYPGDINLEEIKDNPYLDINAGDFSVYVLPLADHAMLSPLSRACREYDYSVKLQSWVHYECNNPETIYTPFCPDHIAIGFDKIPAVRSSYGELGTGASESYTLITDSGYFIIASIWEYEDVDRTNPTVLKQQQMLSSFRLTNSNVIKPGCSNVHASDT